MVARLRDYVTRVIIAAVNHGALLLPNQGYEVQIVRRYTQPDWKQLWIQQLEHLLASDDQARVKAMQSQLSQYSMRIISYVVHAPDTVMGYVRDMHSTLQEDAAVLHVIGTTLVQLLQLWNSVLPSDAKDVNDHRLQEMITNSVGVGLSDDTSDNDSFIREIQLLLTQAIQYTETPVAMHDDTPTLRIQPEHVLHARFAASMLQNDVAHIQVHQQLAKVVQDINSIPVALLHIRTCLHGLGVLWQEGLAQLYGIVDVLAQSVQQQQHNRIRRLNVANSAWTLLQRNYDRINYAQLLQDTSVEWLRTHSTLYGRHSSAYPHRPLQQQYLALRILDAHHMDTAAALHTTPHTDDESDHDDADT